jgi:predicted transcriptional regulator
MTLMNVMAEKGLVVRHPDGRAFVYRAARPRENTLGGMVKDLLGRAFEGSPSALVTHMLDQSQPSYEELEEIRRILDDYQQQETA